MVMVKWSPWLRFLVVVAAAAELATVASQPERGLKTHTIGGEDNQICAPGQRRTATTTTPTWGYTPNKFVLGTSTVNDCGGTGSGPEPCGPDYWWNAVIAGKENQCDATKFTNQSPINLNSNIAYPPITDQVPNTSNAKLVFNPGEGCDEVELEGLTYTWEVVASQCAADIGVTWNNKFYKLVQFHFHHTSEHTVDNFRFPLEAHFVHKADDGELLVVGSFVKVGKTENSFLASLFAGNTPLAQGGTPIEGPIDLYSFLPNSKKFWHYLGSLTTPPCTNGVQWFVLKKSITISWSQAYDITQFLEDTADPQQAYLGQDARPTQPLAGRTIYDLGGQIGVNVPPARRRKLTHIISDNENQVEVH